MALLNVFCLIVLVGLAAFFDARERRIPNNITLPTILLGWGIGLISGGVDGLLQSLLGTLAGFAIFFIPFVLGGMGAGDVKLLGAVGSLMGWDFSVLTAVYSALVGGLMVLAVLLYQRKLKSTLISIASWLVHFLTRFILMVGPGVHVHRLDEKLAQKNQGYRKMYIPYGVAIGCGAVLVLLADHGFSFL